MNRSFYFISVSLLIVSYAGCLEATDAWPAIINEDVLEENGWEVSGDVQKQNQTVKIYGAEIKMNTAVMNYRDRELALDIIEQVEEIGGLIPEETSGASQITSQLFTVRIVLPTGITIPSEVVESMIDRQLDQIASQNNIRDFHEVGTFGTTLINGKDIEVKNYEGYIDFKGGVIKIKGMSASWLDSGSTVVVFGVMPNESIIITSEQIGTFSIKISGEQESEEMIELIRNVE